MLQFTSGIIPGLTLTSNFYFTLYWNDYIVLHSMISVQNYLNRALLENTYQLLWTGTILASITFFTSLQGTSWQTF